MYNSAQSSPLNQTWRDHSNVRMETHLTISNKQDPHRNYVQERAGRAHENSIAGALLLLLPSPKFINNYPRAPQLSKDNLDYDLMQLYSPQGSRRA